MTARRLLRLYPRAWRERYGNEFLELLGAEPLQLQQIIDILSGAIDARFSADVRGVTRAHAIDSGGTTMIRALSICARNEARYTKRDGIIGAAIMLLGALLFTIAGVAMRRNGLETAGDMLMTSGYLVSMLVSMPYWLLKGQPRTAQLVFIGGTATIVLAINVLAAMF
ncbi:MAG TPA: hypothetical protein VEA16_01975 [Vicinamibacterales bacterium]|nr:hypothetical protein [Vicinamibacterales bacterium]